MNDSNLVPVIRASKLLCLDHLQEICFKFIKQRVNLRTALFYLHLSYKYCLFSAKQFVLNFIGRCFEQIVKGEEFLKLDVDLVEEIFSHPELNLTSEMQVCLAAESWVSHDPQQRSEFAARLVSTARFSLLSKEAVDGLKKKENFANCREVVENATREANCSQRCCDDENFYLYVCGGMIKNRLTGKSHMMKANDPKRRTHALPPMTTPRRNATALQVAGEVYLMGGYDGEDRPVKTVDVYSMAKNRLRIMSKYVILEKKYFFKFINTYRSPINFF